LEGVLEKENNINIEAINVLSNEIAKAVEQITIKCDKTFTSVVKQVNPNGTYIVLDQGGSERIVKCSIPGLELGIGQNVWVKMPCGSLNGLHICGVK
jgi:ferredoxin-fold anticodon binding domain-containing protein